eukprot:8113-Eustigmatos_ZCMA.PRE.1
MIILSWSCPSVSVVFVLGANASTTTTQGMVKKIVDTLLEEEYDDMYYSMRMKDDLELYKKANWQRAVQLVLGL